MRHSEARWVVLTVLSLIGSTAASEEAEREMNLREGPDSVFAVPVEALFPLLEGAEATGRNGRVGGELVFWGYRLSDGRDVALVACAMRSNVDCAAREAKVCPVTGALLARSTAEGLVNRRTCRSISFAAPGDIRPGCIDRDDHEELAVSLLQCR
jgi:hypothetical protein